MKAAILGGTGVYSIEGIQTASQPVETDYGSVEVMNGKGEWKLNTDRDKLFAGEAIKTIKEWKVIN